MMKGNIVKLLILVLPIVSFLTGCSDAKSYYYYLNNPGQLEMDYKFCAENPGRTLCDGIVAKYIKYNNALQSAKVISARKFSADANVAGLGGTRHNVRNKQAAISVFADLDKSFEEVYL